MRPEDVRKSSMVSMMKVWKDLLKFVMLERAAATISLSWIRGLIFMFCDLKRDNSKLLKNQALVQIFQALFSRFSNTFSGFSSRSFDGCLRHPGTGYCCCNELKII